MSERKLFGTDGIRGKANVYPMTPEVAMLLGRAVTHYFQRTSKRNTKPLIIVGKDTRLSCYMLEQAFSAGVCAQGGEVVLTGPLSTPGVAFVTTSMRADAGVMISASHNKYNDNGIKIFDAYGRKLPDSVEAEIEELVLTPNLMPLKIDAGLGNAKRLKEVFGRYIVHAKSALSDDFDLEGMRIVLDCAHGAGYQVTPMMFQELGAEIFPLGITPNGTNINEECGSMYPSAAAKAVVKYRADVGICLDGDADRLVVVDENGEVVDGDKLIGLFAWHLLSQGVLKKGDTVVGTVMTNFGLEVYLKSLGLNLHRSQVGDRYIVEYMQESGSLLGGEPSGHIIFRRHSTTGDGALAALKLFECIKIYKKTVSELASGIDLYPQVLVNVTVAKKVELDKIPAMKEVMERATRELGEKGRLLVRYSGTEPLARVMVEGENQELVDKLCHEIAAILKKELGA